MTGQIMLVIIAVTASMAAAVAAFGLRRTARPHPDNAPADSQLRDRPPKSATDSALPAGTTTLQAAAPPTETAISAESTPAVPIETTTTAGLARSAAPTAATAETAASTVPAERAEAALPKGASTQAATKLNEPPSSNDKDDFEFTLEIPDRDKTDKTPSDPAAGPNIPAVPAVPVPPAVKPNPRPALDTAQIFARLFELALGKARPPAELHAGHADLSATVSGMIAEVATQDRYAPRRPNMLPRVLSASADDSFSRRELATLIARDPSLVGNVLKIANSSYYRVSPQPVESVDRAVVLLGTDGIRSVVTAALMQPIFRIAGANFPRFPEIAWEHTFRSASASVPYNFLKEQSDPFAAELLSLVFGLAQIVIFRVTMDQYARNPKLRPDAGVVSTLLDTHAAEVGRRIGTTWELSAATLAGLEGQSLAVASYPSALGRSVYFGRVAGALAVLRVTGNLDDDTAKASIPVTNMPESQLDRMWTRLTYTSEKS